MNFIARYLHWLHTRWPSGTVEKLPAANDDGSTHIPGLYIAGDLRGVALLKFAADSGTRVVRTIAARSGSSARDRGESSAVDIVIIGAGVAGVAAAMEAAEHRLSYRLLEANAMFSTIANFPRRKPIFTYPKEMTPVGSLQVTADTRESLYDELMQQATRAGVRPEAARAQSIKRQPGALEVVLDNGTSVLARNVVCALGRSGDFRRLGVPGEELDKVTNRLHDPHDYAGQRVLVVGGGDTALETASALADAGARVTLCHRQAAFSRPKPENIGAVEQWRARGVLETRMSSRVTAIRSDAVVLQTASGERTLPNDAVFVMIGREAPLDFFRRAGVKIAGEWTWRTAAGLAAFLIFCTALYNWKSGGWLNDWFYQQHWWPTTIHDAFSGANPNSLRSVIATSASSPAFWYTLAYSVVVTVFGIRRIRRRRTPYVALQTWVLMAIQVLPLFLLPEIILPYLGRNGLLPSGLLDALFPLANYGNGREYWRAYGLVLAWPLNVYNVFTDHPLGWWLAIAFVQTFVIIPLLIYRWGKGAYCGWICSCGALAETLGDTHRGKMLHGKAWNRANGFGQIVLAVAFLMLAMRIGGWVWPGSWADRVFPAVLHRYKWTVDVFLAGVIGYGFYFWFSGRVWCRFMCPLAALMHVYARFSRFAIVADKKKCISCNVCTSVCHQGIDVMNFANKGLAMQDPECVRCSACVQSCPTGVLTFGRVDRAGRTTALDRLPASPVQQSQG
ncbi:MAG TPA: NAD(P)-binding domain-containing protein [Candidatus Krumholzibacteria bacterium]|nr:NAD(P)-binding domain-containing protein [Candidatus Krumholzibacteria bacterium]